MCQGGRMLALFILCMFVLSLPLIIAVTELTIGKGTTVAFCRVGVEIGVSALKAVFGEENYMKGAVILLAGVLVAFGLLATTRGLLFSDLADLTVPAPTTFNQ